MKKTIDINIQDDCVPFFIDELNFLLSEKGDLIPLVSEFLENVKKAVA